MHELMTRCWVCAANIPDIPKGSVPKLVRYFVLRRNTPSAGVEIIQKDLMTIQPCGHVRLVPPSRWAMAEITLAHR